MRYHFPITLAVLHRLRIIPLTCQYHMRLIELELRIKGQCLALGSI